MILLSGDPVAIFIGLGIYVVVFFVLWTLLFYLFEKVNPFNITNERIKKVAYWGLSLIELILSFIACGAIFGML